MMFGSTSLLQVAQMPQENIWRFVHNNHSFSITFYIIMTSNAHPKITKKHSSALYVGMAKVHPIMYWAVMGTILHFLLLLLLLLV